jgi:hypothetical protein
MNRNCLALSPKDALTLYPVLGCLGTLANMQSQKRGIPFYKVGKKVLYRPTDIENYLFSNPVQTIDSVESGR